MASIPLLDVSQKIFIDLSMMSSVNKLNWLSSTMRPVYLQPQEPISIISSSIFFSSLLSEEIYGLAEYSFDIFTSMIFSKPGT